MVRLEELSSDQLLEVIEGGTTTVVVPFGSIESHSGHLPLGSDALLADHVGEEVARRLNAVLAPTVRVGSAAAHMERIGTLSISPEALHETAFDIGCSLYAHGFRAIALISTHGGNQAPLEEAAGRVNQRYPDAVAYAPRGDVGPDPGAHSGPWLTSVMLVVRPDLVNVESARADDVRSATAAQGAENLERFISSIVHAVG
jgi:creatinine amidohydrolase